LQILLLIIFGLLFFALTLLTVERARKKKAARLAERTSQDAAATGVNGDSALTPLQRRRQRARRRRDRMNASKGNDTLHADAGSL
jgi:hypothetical protein